VNVECGGRVLIKRRDEDDDGHRVLGKAAEHREPVHHRHLNVEEHEIGTIFDDLRDGVAAVLAFADELDALHLAQQATEPLASHWFVVDDEYTHIGTRHR
jgi:hypothetical protein